MFLKSSVFILIALHSLYVYSQDDRNIENRDHWIGNLQMNDRLVIPFDFDFNLDEINKGLIIRNGSEKIKLRVRKKKDSLIAYFQEINAQLVFKPNQNEMRGYWINFNKNIPVKIPYSGHRTGQNKFEIPSESLLKASLLKERYKVYFEKSKKTSIGQFASDSLEWEGTFMTETGDYRFFSGFCYENKFKLSSFNGNWAMLVEGEILKDSINGKLYSGVSYSTSFSGKYDVNYNLRDPNELTFVVNDKEFNFEEIKTLRNKQFNPEKNKGRVIIYQIMGTWCPNCIDEMNYYKELFAQYEKKGLSIHAFSYEIAKKNTRMSLKALKKFKKRMKLNYPIYLAGIPSTDLASSHFPMLNHVMSYPTSIVVDKKGVIRKVHTGFNGPATGDAYETFKYEMDKLIKQLLDE
jgi:thiol-disulfide isomerase/thioredoxin